MCFSNNAQNSLFILQHKTFAKSLSPDKILDLSKLKASANDNFTRVQMTIIVWCLMPFSTVFQLYQGGHFPAQYSFRSTGYFSTKPLSKQPTAILVFRLTFTP